MLLRICSRLLTQNICRTKFSKYGAVSSTYVINKANYSSQYYPIDENLFGLSDEQQEVSFYL